MTLTQLAACRWTLDLDLMKMESGERLGRRKNRIKNEGRSVARKKWGLVDGMKMLHTNGQAPQNTMHITSNSRRLHSAHDFYHPLTFMTTWN